MKRVKTVRYGVLALSLGLSLGLAQAEVLKDPQWRDWLEAGKSTELEQAAQARLKAEPEDSQAVLALGLLALEAGDPKRVESAIKPVQACADRQPAQAACLYVLGSLQGVQAMSGGMMKAISLSGKIKDNLSRAVELDPLLFDARDALQQFYLMAPGIAGGSVSKARELAAAAQARQPEHAKLLRARVEIKEERWAEAERELSAIKAGEDKDLLSGQRAGLYQLAIQLFSEKQYAKAKPLFERLQRDFPAHAAGHYGMGRLLSETGQIDEAIKSLERARTAEGADRYAVDHRLGFALLAKGDKAQGKTVLERFLGNKKANPRNQDEVRKRLAELG
ncbi:tetratricopeptide repeat protein [Paucibacter sp. DJ2R-2]|uniref:tetratricopeptide repeat protein n=1 Tax=Paucibacter sp. DJ2R-2 TaxID=2893558 RepID=UPI0021E47542|nr:tetratricopeptide repeat protein [Paucibacter sp. DJ2R-2]MCV2423528.1 tetratricopeptide repeat protein [Paucibacter sp. DJ4R-1]MCV2440580.1 tetratricopeptide repeat protein [Paucibacter sp. DJ2R-2]